MHYATYIQLMVRTIVAARSNQMLPNADAVSVYRFTRILSLPALDAAHLWEKHELRMTLVRTALDVARRVSPKIPSDLKFERQGTDVILSAPGAASDEYRVRVTCGSR